MGQNYTCKPCTTVLCWTDAVCQTFLFPTLPVSLRLPSQPFHRVVETTFVSAAPPGSASSIFFTVFVGLVFLLFLWASFLASHVSDASLGINTLDVFFGDFYSSETHSGRQHTK